jgi:beta-galactosidase GanA
VPDNIEVSLREGQHSNVFFLLNHQSTAVRVQFYKQMHDFLTAQPVAGGHDIPPHGVLVLDERHEDKS